MDEIERFLGEFIGGDIMAAHLEIGIVERRHELRFQIRGHDMSGTSHLLAQPSRNRAASSPHLQAAPAPADTDALKMPDRPWILELLQAGKPVPLLLPLVAKLILRHDHSLRSCEKIQRMGPRLTGSPLACEAVIRGRRKITDTCADGLSSPSGPLVAQMNFLKLNPPDRVTCDGPGRPKALVSARDALESHCRPFPRPMPAPPRPTAAPRVAAAPGVFALCSQMILPGATARRLPGSS